VRAIRLPNGNLLIPVEEPDESDDGDSMVEITPDDPRGREAGNGASRGFLFQRCLAIVVLIDRTRRLYRTPLRGRHGRKGSRIPEAAHS
jgi:hypothetical protein